MRECSGPEGEQLGSGTDPSSSSTAAGPRLEVREVSKRFDLYYSPVDRLKEWLLRGRRNLHREVWAVRDVSFSLEPGRSLGFLGPNGAGKTTLLRILAGVTAPTEGSISREGRVGTLIDLGAGFRMDMPGLFNLHMLLPLMGVPAEEVESLAESITRRVSQ